jgi:hypothetical protein
MGILMMKKALATSAVAIALLGGGAALGARAEAGSLTNTSTSTNVLVSAKCYRHHGVSTTMFHWDSKQNKYVPYDSTHHSTTDYTKCHK